MAKEKEEPQVPEDFDLIDIDMPTPDETVIDVVKDEHAKEPAFQLSFIGSGQGGGRIAHAFWKLGYRRVASVNSAIQDISPLPLPQRNKLLIGQGGAGGDPETGSRCAKEHKEDIYDLMRRCFGTKFDRIFVTATAGGGTGSGSVMTIVDAAHDLLDKLELSSDTDPKVGVIIALPKESDGKKAHANAAKTLQELIAATPRKVSPLIIVDNQQIDKLYPKLPVGEYWEQVNHNVCQVFHTLNLVAAMKSNHTSFDSKDMETLLKSGMMTFGTMRVPKWSEREDISVAIRDNLKRTLLVDGFDLTSGTVAGCVVIGNKDVLAQIPQVYMDDGFSMLGRMLNVDAESAVHRGIYATNKPGLVVYTMVGGLLSPKAKMTDLRSKGGMPDHDGV